MLNGYSYIFGIILIISITVLSLSMYGIGREEDNKSSTGYQSASVFTVISLITGIVSTILLGISLMSKSKVGNHSVVIRR